MSGYTLVFILISSRVIPKSSSYMSLHSHKIIEMTHATGASRQEVKGRVRVLCNTLDAFKSQNRFGNMGIKVQTGRADSRDVTEIGTTR